MERTSNPFLQIHFDGVVAQQTTIYVHHRVQRNSLTIAAKIKGKNKQKGRFGPVRIGLLTNGAGYFSYNGAVSYGTDCGLCHTWSFFHHLDIGESSSTAGFFNPHHWLLGILAIQGTFSWKTSGSHP